MLADYLGLVAVLFAGGLLVAAALVASRRLAPRPESSEPSIAASASAPRRRVPVKFFLVALLFVAFNVQALFLAPWAAVLRELGGFGLAGLLLFSLPLVVGLAYQRAKGGLEW